jgi:hypothetical protein
MLRGVMLGATIAACGCGGTASESGSVSGPEAPTVDEGDADGALVRVVDCPDTEYYVEVTRGADVERLMYHRRETVGESENTDVVTGRLTTSCNERLNVFAFSACNGERNQGPCVRVGRQFIYVDDGGTEWLGPALLPPSWGALEASVTQTAGERPLCGRSALSVAASDGRAQTLEVLFSVLASRSRLLLECP